MIFSYIISFFCCAYGQPCRFPLCGIIAASFGYALFFYSLKKTKKPWLFSFIWFFALNLVQLSWMGTTVYQGIGMLFLYGLLSAVLSLEFVLLCKFVLKSEGKGWFVALTGASFWMLAEWSRLYFLCGFSWNPLGMSLACHTYSLGMASLFGIYGLSFWVVFTNIFLFRTTRKSRAFWCFFALFPYLFGFLQAQYVDRTKSEETLATLLIQTALSPAEKEGYFSYASRVLPEEQWRQIFELLKKEKGKKTDLILLPEIALPLPAFYPHYYLDTIESIWFDVFKEPLPPFSLAKASYLALDEERETRISNAYIAQSIADFFQGEVVIGLDASSEAKSYNAAFHFLPNGQPSRYDKRILVPLGEYIPFEWCRKLAAQYGIQAFFEQGEKPVIFQGKVKMNPSICYEETYPHIVREGCLLGGELLVNLTNDGWFPETSLTRQHFEHGRIRAVENGRPLVRATNTGITGAVDALGRVQKILLPPSGKSRDIEYFKGALHVEVPLFTFPTLYLLVGDLCLVLFSLFILGLYFLKALAQNTSVS